MLTRGKTLVASSRHQQASRKSLGLAGRNFRGEQYLRYGRCQHGLRTAAWSSLTSSSVIPFHPRQNPITPMHLLGSTRSVPLGTTSCSMFALNGRQVPFTSRARTEQMTTEYENHPAGKSTCSSNVLWEIQLCSIFRNPQNGLKMGHH